MSKSLKKLLTAKVGKDTKIKSLEEAIYRSVKDKPTRNVNNMVKASKKITRTLIALSKGETVDFDQMNNEFLAFLSEFNAEGPRDKRKFHPSSLRRDCERQLVYLLGGSEYSDRIADFIDGRLQIIFDQGHWFHSYIQAALFKAGILIQSEVPVVDKARFIGGRMDGKIIWNGEVMALEVKTMNSFRFTKGKLAPFDDNVYQNSFYANHLGIKKILFLYFNKDTSEIAIHIRDTDTTMAKLANEKIDSVLNHIEDATLPRRVCTSKDVDQAKQCPFRTLCFTTKDTTIKKSRKDEISTEKKKRNPRKISRRRG